MSIKFQFFIHAGIQCKKIISIAKLTGIFIGFENAFIIMNKIRRTTKDRKSFKVFIIYFSKTLLCSREQTIEAQQSDFKGAVNDFVSYIRTSRNKRNFAQYFRRFPYLGIIFAVFELFLHMHRTDKLSSTSNEYNNYFSNVNL